jgi:aspartyl-tRNA(Asn)/glutamyl-tRNA(Gln) amidotransferase subunit A
MTDLTRDEFLTLAKQAGLDPADPHLDDLMPDVQTMLDRLVLMGAANVEAREPQFGGQHPAGPQAGQAPSVPSAAASRRREAPSDVADMTVAELAVRVGVRELSPVDIVKAFSERVEALEPKLNAFITRTFEQAMVAARQAESDIIAGNYKGPLHGIPVALKDLYWTKGVRTTSGSAITADFVPDEDATVVARLQDAGAYSIGKTGMVEYAYGGFEHNDLYGEPKNPWNVAHVTGGSSSGSGSAVAGGQVPLALGSDTAGSVRGPASYCGLSGLKPTFGLVSKFGVSTLGYSLDHVGPMAHTAEDVAIAMNAMAGYDPRDANSADHPREDYVAQLRMDAKGLRIGVPSDDYIWSVVHPEVKTAFDASIRELESLGAAVETIAIGNLEPLAIAQNVMTLAEATSYHSVRIRSRPELFHPAIRRKIESGLFLPAEAYVKALRIRNLFEHRFAGLFETFDLLATPTTHIPAPEFGQAFVQSANGDISTRESVRFTRLFNPNGLPAISIPNGFSAEGMPIGLQLVGKRLADGLVTGVAHAYQQTTDWHLRRPL